jgi:hypothetical protein
MNGIFNDINKFGIGVIGNSGILALSPIYFPYVLLFRDV